MNRTAHQEKPQSSSQHLPPVSTLSTASLTHLNANLQSLSHATTLASKLQSQCANLDLTLTTLHSRLESTLASYASSSTTITLLARDLHSKLNDLASLTNSAHPPASLDGDVGRAEQILGEELPALAREVAAVEMVRMYAGTALRLDTLVGDIEDSVSSAMTKKLMPHSSTQNSNDIYQASIGKLNLAEEILASVTKTRPNWVQLVSSVDHRVDRALAILRPQAIADHRALLTSLGWPPPLSTLTSSVANSGKASEISNPLFTAQGNLKNQYCKSFLALCSLQELQRRRKYRQLEGYDQGVALNQPLWTIEELANPISIQCQRHFAKWIDKPEFIFALVYKITRDYVDSMDELLQPLVDEAMLVGYSCREEWISAMVTSLTTYLAKEIFPTYVNQLDEGSLSGDRAQARISWLHIVDLMTSFDKQVKSLVVHSGISLPFEEGGNLQKISSLAVFCDRPDWLELWAEIELADSIEKLESQLVDERYWTKKIQKTDSSTGSEDYKSPAISSAILRHLSSVIERCRSIPITALRSRFLRLAAAPIIQKIFGVLLLRCQEAEGLTALTDNDAIVKVVNSINASHYLESILKEWCEDVFFLEMSLDEDVQHIIPVENTKSTGQVKGPGIGIFDEEIQKLEEFRLQWIEKLSIVVLRGFDAQFRDHIKNRRQWQEKLEDGWRVSRTLMGALDYLQGKVSVVEESLNTIDFISVWRSIAAGIDQLLFNSILMGNVKFSNGGVERFGNDLEVLFGVFAAWCLRPEGFFPKASEGMKLLKMEEKQLKDSFAEREKWMKNNKIRHLREAEVEKIVKSRVFTD